MGYRLCDLKESQTTEQLTLPLLLLMSGKIISTTWASQVILVIRNPAANAGDIRDPGLIPGSGKPPGGRHGN